MAWQIMYVALRCMDRLRVCRRSFKYFHNCIYVNPRVSSLYNMGKTLGICSVGMGLGGLGRR